MDDKKIARSTYRNLIHVPTHNFAFKIKTRNVKCSGLFDPSLPVFELHNVFNANVNQFKYSKKASAQRQEAVNGLLSHL